MSLAGIANFLEALEWWILLYFLAVNGFYLLLLVSAAIETTVHLRGIRGERRWRVLSSSVAPRITVFAPAYNEEANIVESVSALLALYYPNTEILVVNDGSTDTTMDVLIREFRLHPVIAHYEKSVETKEITGFYESPLYPNLVVVEKKNGGKADAMNAALNVASGELICAIDSDTLVEPDALQRMVRPFLTGPGILAAGGTVRVINACTIRRGRVVEDRVPRSYLAGIQMIEYLRAFLFGRVGWNRLGGNLVISGAFGLFRRESLIAAGGYASDSIGEDMELIVRLRRIAMDHGKPHRVDFIPDPVAWTEVPEALRSLGNQRDRWHRGLADALWRHRTMVFNPRYGSVGLVAIPQFVLVELIAPVIETIGIFGLIVGLLLGAVNWPFAMLFFLVAYGLGMIFSLVSILLDEIGYTHNRTVPDRLLLILWAFLENIGYRQLTVYWRMRGIWKYFRGSQDWGEMKRKGFATDTTVNT